jgi:tetratricopeptide (TPR) repeat protein
LYKIMLLIKLAILKQAENEEDSSDASFNEILESTLEMIDNYKPAIGSHYLTHYLRSLIYILLEKLEESREALERTFKVTEECSWKLLYVKGVVEMQLGNYYDAVKEFSAGLIL